MKKKRTALSKTALAALALGIATAAGALPGLTSPQTAAAAVTANQKVVYPVKYPVFKQSGQLYVPLRDTAALFDLHLTFNAQTKALELTGVAQYAKLQPGSAQAVGKNAVPVSLGAPVQIRYGVTYVPASLFSKLFGIPVSAAGTQKISYVYSSKYRLTQADGTLFWLNRKQGVLYGGETGQLPTRLGTVNIEFPDTLNLSARKVGDTAYVVDIDNAYGEPHIFSSLHRALIHDGSVVAQSSLSYGGGVSQVRLNNAALSADGRIVLNEGQTAQLVTPDGKVAETIDLAKLGGPDDEYGLEAVEPDFLLIRPFSTGALLVVDRATGKSTPLYRKLLDQASIGKIDSSDWSSGDGLVYTGRDGNRLSFQWALPGSGKRAETVTYELGK
ncbi:copper amine oxidase N-terminal domain-containing protein [Paenibacillus sp. A14]|uniref:copper amine oxidase N-terminal domain-containing protein n=1 Tax=Paenibacillus sp. A14 TaxID=3119820 RepID=UPI002FE2C252